MIVLDFIANYKENYLIPVALSGDRSYDKDTLRRFVAVEHRLIPGSSTIEFDSITKEKIFEAIDRAQTQSKKLLREAYTALKFKLGHRPTLQEFEDNNSIDVIKYFDVFGSYYSFLKDSDTEFKDRMSLEAETVLTYFSSKLGRAQRISEVLVLEDLLAGQGRLMHRLATSLSTTYHRSRLKLTEKMSPAFSPINSARMKTLPKSTRLAFSLKKTATEIGKSRGILRNYCTTIRYFAIFYRTWLHS